MAEDTGAVLREGRRVRRLTAKGKVEAKRAGIPWEDAMKIFEHFGPPPGNSDEREAWKDRVRKKGSLLLGYAPRGRDWEAFFNAFADFAERMIPIFVQLFKGCAV